ncbi:uncharacterized protein BDZ83DRAFT_624851 [Colletotrichum acutatum]|uniref:Uncharacterized protein n=1 Tax=Glomerella acutata TaxID=27357 RepID=A0AAD8UMK4_GLOAC|nr:uncharacterized protein BDZ83DRAFT_624851 [Colletotrichum acutatum]KAK1723834.1 hypothetical protein BDZ83DRAFT_624851 [Colletotrichum acutatum]
MAFKIGFRSFALIGKVSSIAFLTAFRLRSFLLAFSRFQMVLSWHQSFFSESDGEDLRVMPVFDPFPSSCSRSGRRDNPNNLPHRRNHPSSAA